MPWFKRKYQPWDKYWDLYLWSSQLIYTDNSWTWRVPDNLCLEIIQINAIVFFDLLAFGVFHAPLIECFRGDLLRWNTAWYATNLSNVGLFATWSKGPEINRASTGINSVRSSLPTPCYVVPGEHLLFSWENKQPNDYWKWPRITAKSWKLY